MAVKRFFNLVLFLYVRNLSTSFVFKMKAAVVLQLFSVFIKRLIKLSLFDLITAAVSGIFSPPLAIFPIRVDLLTFSTLRVNFLQDG